MRLGLLVDGYVTHVAEVDPDQIPEHLADWVPLDEAGLGWRFVDDVFVPPEPPAQPAMSAGEAERLVLSAISAVELALTGGVPLAEKLSWPAKEAAAASVLAGTAGEAETAFLAGEAALTGETVAELAQRVIARAAAYRFAASRLAGIRRAAETRIAAAQSPAALEQAVALAQAQCAAILEAAANGV